MALCHTVRAVMRATVRDGSMGPTHGSEGRCSIRGAYPHSREPGLHGNVIGLHQKASCTKSAISRPLPESRPDSGRFEAHFLAVVS